MHRYCDVSLKGPLYEYDLPIYDAPEPPMLQLSTVNFQEMFPIYFLEKSENLSIVSPFVSEIFKKNLRGE